MDSDSNYEKFLEKYNVKDPEHPKHYYDYHAAWESGAKPNEEGHWPSEFKHDLHPNRYISVKQDQWGNKDWVDTKSGKKATEIDVIMQSYKREDFEDTLENML